MAWTFAVILRAEAHTHFILKGSECMKDKKLSIRISEDELMAVHSRAEDAGLSLTDYVTDCCLGKQIVVINGLDDVLKEQKAIGRNLNQLTMLCNMGRIQAPDLEELIQQYAHMNEMLSEILERRRWSYGDG